MRGGEGVVDIAKEIVELCRSHGLTILQAEMACDRAKGLLKMEPLAKKNEAAQDECAAGGCEG